MHGGIIPTNPPGRLLEMLWVWSSSYTPPVRIAAAPKNSDRRRKQDKSKGHNK